MQTFSLITYADGQASHAGLLADGKVIALDGLFAGAPMRSVADVLERWDEALPIMRRMAADPAHPGKPLDGVRLLAPVPAPLAIYCMGANYQKHMDNMMRAQGAPMMANMRDKGMPPYFFLKSGHCVVPSGAEVALDSGKLDWEAELVAVVGRVCRNVAPEHALAHVAGYTIANDLSARDRAVRKNGDPTSPFFFDFVSQKSFDGSCPLGPSLVPSEFVRDPQALGIKLWVNDRLRVDASTEEMIYPIAEQIAHLSTFVTLHPGDVILTGTPAGAGMETGEFLARGDRVLIAIDGLGELETTIV